MSNLKHAARCSSWLTWDGQIGAWAWLVSAFVWGEAWRGGWRNLCSVLHSPDPTPRTNSRFETTTRWAWENLFLYSNQIIYQNAITDTSCYDGLLLWIFILNQSEKWNGKLFNNIIIHNIETAFGCHLGGVLKSSLQGCSPGPWTIEVLLTTVPCYYHLWK